MAVTVQPVDVLWVKAGAQRRRARQRGFAIIEFDADSSAYIPPDDGNTGDRQAI